MTVSSRTPEGDPNRCPVCGKALRLEPSRGTRDGPCPHCGHLLWFSKQSGGTESWASQAAEAALRLGTIRLGRPPAGIETTIRGIQDRERLESIMHRLVTVQSWEELLAEA